MDVSLYLDCCNSKNKKRTTPLWCASLYSSDATPIDRLYGFTVSCCTSSLLLGCEAKRAWTRIVYAPADLGDEQHVLGLGDFSGSVPTHGAPHSAVC